MQDWLIGVLPVASALAGVAVTSWAQTRMGIQQRHHDREMRYFDDKRTAYTRYAALVLETSEQASLTLKSSESLVAASERNDQ